ncbi:fad nadph dehydrogenase/oxidoreductase [Holotrichia oblita]|uniref:Fad nadph dehydrogenase/oxidoreductase n=1 Tax=Holotrichia oblita TaxID=644536 RepID=A0ACB9SX04_HOLOL|nr:fad nadph dehydrogenase/oxidoreductase [Holotrichia oblita]
MKKICFKLARALYSTSQNTEVKICVIGSGPVGFYASQHLVKHIPSVKIDIYEKLPVPFGLVRYDTFFYTNTDITQHALEVLSTSKIKEVYLIGRRGPLQAAFTIKELREMLKLKNCGTYWCDSDFVEFSGSTGDVEKLKLCVNKLEGADILRQKAVFTEDVEYLSCDLAVTSIGYKSLEVDPAIPFDSNRGIAKNANGKISDGVFTTGWLATGPTGVILSTMSNAFGVAEYIVSDLKKCSIESKPGFASVEKLLEKRGVQLVFWENWLKIDAYEQEMGKKLGKPREKIVTIKKMLEVAE